MKKHTKYSHYRPMILAGFISGLIVSLIGGTLLWLLAPSGENSLLEKETTKHETGNIVSAEELPEEKPIELLLGGTKVLPGYRYVALYGNPEYKTLGALGEQSYTETFARLKSLSEQYQVLSTEKVIPTLELITTIASAGPTEDDDYSQELDISKIKAWVEEANNNDVYVVLDLQPGRDTFVHQAQNYEEVLKMPNVGLALDPEWRLQTMNDRHLKKVGSVTAEEVNLLSEWLANLVKDNELPQKMFIVHQFKDSMITNRETLKTDREELAYVLHMDGHGSMGQKVDTWNRLKTNLPTNMFMAWKNFYDEDLPTPTPEQTMQQQPQPVFISYQ